MKPITKKIVILSILLFIILLILFTPLKQEKYSINDNVPSSGSTLSDITILKEILENNIEDVKKKSNWLTPYNKNIMDVIIENSKVSNTLNSISTLTLLLPNNSLFTKPLKPLINPTDALVFQFEQGTLGWYWGYSTFIIPNKEPMSIMFYIMHVDISNPVLRKKYKLKPQETASYYVSTGIGRGTEWRYSPYKYIRGKYDIFSKTLFKFESLDDDIQCVFESLNELNFNLIIKWKDNNKLYGFNTVIKSIQQPYFNAKNGCAPCTEGLGTLYWSYTHLKFTDTTFIFNNNTDGTSREVIPVSEEGIGWMDVQWGRGGGGSGGLQTRFMQSLINISLFSKSNGGLGRYIWINIHIENGDDYMVYSFLDENIKIEKNNIINNTNYNTYSSSLKNPIYNKKTTMTILDTVIIIDNNGINIVFPIKYSIEIKDKDDNSHLYLLDSTSFGNTVTIDNISNLHWSGSTLLYENNNIVGTGFLEANQFQNKEDYFKNIFKNNNLIGSYDGFLNKRVLSFSQIIPSLVLLLILLILIILWIIYLIKYIRN